MVTGVFVNHLFLETRAKYSFPNAWLFPGCQIWVFLFCFVLFYSFLFKCLLTSFGAALTSSGCALFSSPRLPPLPWIITLTATGQVTWISWCRKIALNTQHVPVQDCHLLSIAPLSLPLPRNSAIDAPDDIIQMTVLWPVVHQSEKTVKPIVIM